MPGTHYHKDTPNHLVEILESIKEKRQRVCFFFGDTKTGQDWKETYGTTGRIGQSTGSKSIPLVVYNARSLGGPALLDHCIVKITLSRGGKVLYQHPLYH